MIKSIATPPKKTWLILAVLFILLVFPHNVSALSNRVTNGNFDSDLSGWTLYESNPSFACYIINGPENQATTEMVPTMKMWTGSNSGYTGNAYISQEVDFTGVDTLSFLKRTYVASSSCYFRVYIDDTSIYQDTTGDSGFSTVNLDVSSYTGTHTLKFYVYDSSGSSYVIQYLDDVVAMGVDPAITWDQSSYSSGETATLDYAIPNFDSTTYEYFIDISSYNSATGSWDLESKEFISYPSYPGQATGSISYSMPSYDSREFKATLSYRQGVLYSPVEIESATTQLTQSGVVLHFDQASYNTTSNLSFSYENLPIGAYVQFHGSGDPNSYFQQWSLSGNGSAGYNLVDGPYNTYFKITAYDGNDNELATDTAYTVNAPLGVSILSGRVRDADSGAPISGVTVTVAGDYATTDEKGDYILSVPKGTWDVQVSATGYITKTYADYSFSGAAYTYSPSLSPSPVAGGTLYGSVYSGETGGDIQNAQVTVYNSTMSKLDFTSSMGRFEISDLVNEQNYTIRVEQDYYEIYQTSLTFDSSDNYIIIPLYYLEGEAGEDNPADPTNPDDPTNPTDPDYRPGRGAAQESLQDLEEIVPGLLMFVVMIVFLNVMKKA